MATYEEVLQQYVNKDYDDLVKVAKGALADLLPELRKYDPDNEGILMLLSIILSGIVADGKFSDLEKKFIAEVTGLKEDIIAGFMGKYDVRMSKVVDKYVDETAPSAKVNTVTFLLCIAACDETITREESAFIHKILE